MGVFGWVIPPRSHGILTDLTNILMKPSSIFRMARHILETFAAFEVKDFTSEIIKFVVVVVALLEFTL